MIGGVEPPDFNLSDEATNRAFAADKMKKVNEVIQDTPEYTIVRTGDGQNGWIIVYRKSNQKAYYAIKYETRNWKWLGQTVTQCVLWRDPSITGLIPQVTSKVFFGYLLKHYPTVMSDRLQTEAGHDFWIGRMAEASSKGFRVGIANVNLCILLSGSIR